MGKYQRIRDLKEDADLTQKQVAAIIGVSENHYGKYERGETDIPLEKAILLADYYHVSLDYIAGRTPYKKEHADRGLSQEQMQIAELYAGLNEKNKGKLELFLAQLLQVQAGRNPLK